MKLRRVTDNTTIPFLNITSCLNENDEIVFCEVYPAKGYVIRMPYLDQIVNDENGDPVISDNGKILIKHTYASTMTEAGSYNWQENPNGYTAELYREGMEDELIEADVPETATETDYINAHKELGVEFNE